AVLIVNYRGYDDLTRCLDSLDIHRRTDDEVVVVDYETQPEKLAAALAGHLGVVTVCRSDNLGFASGINLGVRNSRAPFLLLLNPDSIVGGPIITALEDYLTAHRDVAVVGPRVLNADDTIQPTARRFPGVTTLLGGRSTWLTSRFPRNWFSRRNLV